MARVKDTATPGFNNWYNDTDRAVRKMMVAENNKAVKKMRGLQLKSSSFFWKNRSKKAGSSISGDVKFESNEYISEIGHGSNVKYAFFLETMQEGRFAMLPSALKYLGFLTLSGLEKLGFVGSTKVTPYEPTANHRLEAQRGAKK